MREPGFSHGDFSPGNFQKWLLWNWALDPPKRLGRRRNLTESQLKLDEVDQQAQNVTQRTFAANLALSDIHERAQKLGQDAKALRDNTTALQEANVEGASRLDSHEIRIQFSPVTFRHFFVLRSAECTFSTRFGQQCSSRSRRGLLA